MKVAMISTYPPARCGIADYTKNLVKGLKGKGVDVSIIDDWKKNSKTLLLDVAEKIGKDRDIDLVHLQYEYMLFGSGISSVLPLLIPTVMKTPGYPTVVTMNLTFPSSSSDAPLLKRTIRNAFTRFLARASAIITHMEHQKEMLKDYGIPGRKVKVIPHGTKIRERESSLSEDERTILYFGFLTPGKGVEHLIRAMPEIFEEFPDAKLIIVGGPHPDEGERGEKYLNELKSEVHDLGDSINFTGYLPNRDLDALISKSSVCVFPYEGAEGTHSCSPLLRVAGFGKACVCTSEIREGKDGRSLMVPPEDSRSLASAIGGLLGDENLRRKLGENLKSWATSWEESAEMHKELYEKVML